MKKIILILLLAVSYQGVAQDSTKFYRNEFGIDATGFIEKFLSFKYDYASSSPNYYVTYRRHFSKGNIRFAVGGDYSKNGVNPSNYLDNNDYQRLSYGLNARIGWEFFNELSRRWQVFYGLDFNTSLFYSKDDAYSWQYGYANGRVVETQSYGIAPMAGFRFRITNRLSLSAETSLSFLWKSTYNRNYATLYPEIVGQDPFSLPFYPARPKVKSVATSFAQPLSIFLAFDI